MRILKTKRKKRFQMLDYIVLCFSCWLLEHATQLLWKCRMILLLEHMLMEVQRNLHIHTFNVLLCLLESSLAWYYMEWKDCVTQLQCNKDHLLTQCGLPFQLSLIFVDHLSCSSHLLWQLLVSIKWWEASSSSSQLSWQSNSLVKSNMLITGFLSLPSFWEYLLSD